MKTILLITFLVSSIITFGQAERLSADIQKMSQDPQFKNAIISIYVADGRSGDVVFEKNSDFGLVPASTLKIMTAVSAYELLGQHTFKTIIGYSGTIVNNVLEGDVVIKGGGDPTLGSIRWSSTKIENVLSKIESVLKKNNITKINGGIFIDDLHFTYQPVPRGWTWEDMGNYFGAGAWGLNWHENKYDLFLNAGKKEGDKTVVLKTSPVNLANNITNLITTGAAGSGDNAIIYSSPNNMHIYANGTIPAGAGSFKISGSIPDPPMEFGKSLAAHFRAKNIEFNEEVVTASSMLRSGKVVKENLKTLDIITSPSLDTIIYWFLHESINMYGETLVKQIGLNNSGSGSTEDGLKEIRSLLQKNGISGSALKPVDGSGLSPANRITTKALVDILQLARNKKWYSSFYNAMPEMNGIKMKSGYIGGVRSYTGYIKSRSGKEYTFAFIINNFDGSASAVRQKMWKILDGLK